MKRSTFSEFVLRQVWTPYNTLQSPASKDRCRAHVPDGGRSVGSHQCTRKPVEELEGFGFCSFHAAEIKNSFGIRDFEKETILYIARFSSNGNSNLSKLHLSKRTEKMITVSAYEDIVGSCYLSAGSSYKMDAHYMRDYKFFDQESEAWLYLYQKAESHWRQCEDDLSKAVENMNILAELVKHEVWNKH